MLTATIGDIRISMTEGELPALYDRFIEHARLVDTFGLQGSEPGLTYLGLSQGEETWPRLVVAQRYGPSEGGFHPEVLVVPESSLLFLGAGTRLLAYDFAAPSRRWEDSANTGFWGWARFGGVVVMSAELECAAWTIDGHKLWSTFVEPPWDYKVERDLVHLDVMGARSSFPLLAGPPV
jgi:hypothetical protein